jgi:hypothetical protein
MTLRAKRKIFFPTQEFTFVLLLAMVNSAGQNDTPVVPGDTLISVNIGVVLWLLM